MIHSKRFITLPHQKGTIKKTYLRTVLTFSDLNNYVDPIGCKFYIPLMRLFHLNTQLFAQKNSHFILFFIALGCICLIFFCIPEKVSPVFWEDSAWVLTCLLECSGNTEACIEQHSCAGIQQQELGSLKLNSNSSWWKLYYSGWTISLKKSWIYLQTPHLPTP